MLSTSAPATVVEGSTIRYTATVDNVVTGTDLELTLTNGQTITIAVGQTTGYVDYVVRADDAYAQADDSLSVTIASNTGGEFENVATAGTVLTSVTDDGDDSTVTLTATVPTTGTTVPTGTVTFYHGNDPTCTGTVHPAGTVFIEEGGDVGIARNEGAVEVNNVVTFFVPAGSPTRIDAANPGNCPF